MPTPPQSLAAQAPSKKCSARAQRSPLAQAASLGVAQTLSSQSLNPGPQRSWKLLELQGNTRDSNMYGGLTSERLLKAKLVAPIA